MFLPRMLARIGAARLPASPADDRPAGPAFWRRLFAGAAGAVVQVAGFVTLGLVGFAPLGAAAPGLGIPAAFTTVGLGGMVAALAGRSVVPAFAPSFATALTLAGLVAVLAADPASFRPDGSVQAVRVLAATGAAVIGCGLLQILLGLAGMGRLARFAPAPVVAGFMTGVALLLINAQVPALLGLTPVQWRMDGLTALSAASLGPLALAAATLACIVWLAPHVRRVPGPLLALVLGVAVFHVAQWLWPGLWLGQVLGALPPVQGLLDTAAQAGSAGLPTYLAAHAAAIGGTSLLLALVGSLESALALRSIDQQFQARHDPARELCALGLANVAGGALMGMPGGVLRALATSVAAAGGQGRAAGVGAAAVFLLLYLFGRGLLQALPTAVLGGIMVFIGWMIVDRPSLQLLRQALQRRAGSDAWVSVAIVAAVAATTFLRGVAVGVAMGLLLSVVVFIRGTNRTLVRAQWSGSTQPSRRVWSPQQEQALRTLRARTTVLELEGALYFGNAASLVAPAEAAGQAGGTVVIDLHRVGTVDESGAAVLRQIGGMLARQGASACLAGLRPSSPVGDALTTFGLPPDGPLRWFDDVDRALEDAESRLLALDVHDPPPVDLASSVLFRGLGDAQCRALAAAMQQRHLPAHGWLFREGDVADALYVVVRGSISLIGGAQGQRLTSPAPGMMFGELGLIDRGLRSAGARADTDVELQMLSTTALDALRASDPALAMRVVENIALHLSDRLRQATQAWTAAAA